MALMPRVAFSRPRRISVRGQESTFRTIRQRLEAAHRRIAEARKRSELPPAEEERPLAEFEQQRLGILKQALGTPNFVRINARKCESNSGLGAAECLPIFPLLTPFMVCDATAPSVSRQRGAQNTCAGRRKNHKCWRSQPEDWSR